MARYRDDYNNAEYDDGYGGGYDDGYYTENRHRGYDDGYTENRHRRKKKHPILRLFLFLAFLAGIYFIGTSSLFSVTRIDVSGNTRFLADDIREMSGVDIGDNIFKTGMAKTEKKLKENPYVEEARVRRKLPDRIIIKVKERSEGFCVRVEGKFAVLDPMGVVLSISDAKPNVTLVEGLEVFGYTKGKELQVNNRLLLGETEIFLRAIRSQGLYFKRIVAAESTVYAYLDDKLLCEGTYEGIEKDIEEVKLVIGDLNKRNVKTGTIIVSESGSCTYTKKVRAPAEAKESAKRES